jgi:uroporphyrinogen decarboxylase
MGFKDWVTPIGTPVKISKDFNLERMEDGSYIYGVGGYIYRLPSEGFYFDTVKYAYDWVETAEDVQKIEYPVMSEMEKGWIKENAPRLRRETDKFITTDIVGGWCDIAGPMLGNAKFYMDMISNKPMIHALFKKLNEVWMKWIDDLVESAGDSIDAVIMYNDLEHELAFGSPEQVREQAKRHTQIFKDGGGFVFTQPHNIQSNVPPENVLALYEAGNEFGKY